MMALDENHIYSRLNWYAPIKFSSMGMPVDPLMCHSQSDCSCRPSLWQFRFDASRCNANWNRQIVFISRRLLVFMFYKIIIVQHPSLLLFSWARPRGQYVFHSHIDRCDRRTLVSCPMTNDVCNQQRQLQLHHMSKSIMFTWICTTNYTIPTDHPHPHILFSRPHKIPERVGIAPNISFDLCVHSVHNLVHAKYNKWNSGRQRSCGVLFGMLLKNLTSVSAGLWRWPTGATHTTNSLRFNLCFASKIQIFYVEASCCIRI